jgi:hypothetical protein
MAPDFNLTSASRKIKTGCEASRESTSQACCFPHNLGEEAGRFRCARVDQSWRSRERCAGPGGLAATILLAAAGLRVKVIERLGVVGGRTSAIAARGFKLDLGPTFFLSRVLEEILPRLGRVCAVR